MTENTHAAQSLQLQRKMKHYQFYLSSANLVSTKYPASWVVAVGSREGE